MATSVNEPVAQVNQTEPPAKQSDKELNFARLRQERDRIAQQAEQERSERLRLQEELDRERSRKASAPTDDDDDDDDSSDPYVDRRKLKKTLSKWEAKFEEKIEKKAEEKARKMLADERNRDFFYRLKAEYPDFDEVMKPEILEKFAETNPKLATKFMNDTNEFEKRENAYLAIKAAGLHKKAEAAPIQDKINQNMRNPYYHPASVSPAPSPMGDFSETGMKNAYQKMKELQQRPFGQK